ncbi:unnamed protein product [Symbiodinium sp. CCMP2592]|nr:unnamed protein product [Symbiodinium sp. CCMP2592]
MVGPLDAMRERMESEWTLSWLAHWMLCGNGWSLRGRYHGWPLGCLQRVRERLDGGKKSGNQHLQTCATTARHVQEGAWKLKMKKGKDKVRILKKKKAGSGNEAVQARLHGVPGAWSQSKKAEAGTRPAQYGVPGAWSQPEEGGGGDEAGAGVPGAKAEAGTRPERLSSTNVESQVRDLGPKKVKVGCLKPEEGELQEEATTSSKDLLSEYVLGAWSQPEEDRGGDKAGVPILNQYGVPGARSQLEEDGGGNQAGALLLNQNRVRGAWSQLEQDGGEERPGGFILNQYGFPRCGSSQVEEDRGNGKAGRAYPQPMWVSEVRKLTSRRRQRQRQGRESLSSTDVGFRGVEAPAEEDRGRDKAGRLILNRYGVPRCGSSSRRRQRQGQSRVWKLEPQPMWVAEVCGLSDKAERAYPESFSSNKTGT